MLNDLLARIWQGAPRSFRRWSMRLFHTRFTVTAGAVVLDARGKVLLLKHRFRGGSGWGIPGGFIEANEQPAEAVRRELREEVGLEIESWEIIAARSFKRVRQIEILFLCRVKTDSDVSPTPQSAEIEKAGWFSLEELPAGLPKDQKLLLSEIASDRANWPD